MEISKSEIPRGFMAQEDKETILFELGFIWGMLHAIGDTDTTAAAVDSCEAIKEIIDKY